MDLIEESGYGITSQWLFRDKCIIMGMFVELSGVMGNRGIKAEKLYKRLRENGIYDRRKTG